jgi:hypothetical protein
VSFCGSYSDTSTFSKTYFCREISIPCPEHTALAPMESLFTIISVNATHHCISAQTLMPLQSKPEEKKSPLTFPAQRTPNSSRVSPRVSIGILIHLASDGWGEDIVPDVPGTQILCPGVGAHGIPNLGTRLQSILWVSTRSCFFWTHILTGLRFRGSISEGDLRSRLWNTQHFHPGKIT